MIWVIALGMWFWLVVTGILNEQSKRIDSDTDKYRTLAKMSDEDKVLAGLKEYSDRVRVEIDNSTPGQYSKSYRYLSILPQKMLVIAQACLENNAPFSLRVWAGKNKLLTDGEFRTLTDELLEFGFIALRNEKESRQGFVWTDMGKAMLEDVLRDMVRLEPRSE